MSATRFPILQLVRRVDLDRSSGLGRFHGRIERADGSHAVAIAHLAAAHASATPEPRGFSGHGLLEEIASRPGRRVKAFIAWDTPARGRALGLVSLVSAGPTDRPRHSIGWLLVAPAARRTGIGTALVDTALAEARRDGACEVWAETHADWAAATAFWRRLGFTPPPVPPSAARRSSGRDAS